MLIRKISLFAALAAVVIFHSRAEAQNPEALGGKLFAPDFILTNADAIGLKPDQREAITAVVKNAQANFAELQRQLKLELEATAKATEKADTDRAAALAQFDKMADREKDIRRAQFAMLLDLRKNLTEEQSNKLAELRSRMMPPPSLREKADRVRAGLQKAQADGRNIQPIGELVQPIDGLVRAGKFAEAEAQLDKVLQALEGPK
jgi:Spy/CpxP family protein refolding chaperone